MVFIDSQYFKINRILLLMVGLWPYQQTKLVRLQVTLLSGILTSCVVFQLTPLLTAECTVDLVVKIFGITLIFIIYLIAYNAFQINMHNVKYVLEQFENIFKEIKDENEICIIKGYWCKIRRYTTRLTLFGMCSIFTIIILRLLAILFNKNEFRSYDTTLFTMEYFIDREKYFHLIMLHLNMASVIGASVIIATGSMFIGCLKCVCGIFQIASYRIEQVAKIDASRITNLKNENTTCMKIASAVDMHRRAIKYCQFIITSFERPVLCLIACSVVCLSLNFFRIFQIISFNRNIKDLIIHLICMVAVLIYLFFGNYSAQEIMDHNDHIFFTVYDIQWYTTPLQVQKMILFLLQRGTKTFHLKFGGLFVASLASFSTLISTSVSYFTVLCSTRK